MEFSRQEYQRAVPFPTPGDLPNPGIEPTSLVFPALSGKLFYTNVTWEALYWIITLKGIILSNLLLWTILEYVGPSEYGYAW